MIGSVPLGNSQHKVLLNLSSVSAETGHAIKELYPRVPDRISLFNSFHGKLGLPAGIPVRQ